MIFLFFISFLVLQRLLELVVARRNAKWLLQNGAVEYGRSHYPYIVALHTAFIISLIAEYLLRKGTSFHESLFVVWVVLIALKIWVISSLGKYWNTRIYRIPGIALVNRGPYRFLKHPNYVIVVAEIALIPMIFGLWYTAIAFSALNAAMLAVRIRVENRALTCDN